MKVNSKQLLVLTVGTLTTLTLIFKSPYTSMEGSVPHGSILQHEKGTDIFPAIEPYYYVLYIAFALAITAFLFRAFKNQG